jgi:hypothetical protein
VSLAGLPLRHISLFLFIFLPKTVPSAFASAFVFFGPCAFPVNEVRSGPATHPRCFASARTVSLQPRGLLRARVASSSGDKLGAGARTCREALTRSPAAPAFGNGPSGGEPGRGRAGLAACFELFRREAMPQNEVFRYGGRSPATGRTGEPDGGKARVIQTAGRQ